MLLACAKPIVVQTDQTSWLDQPPPPEFCEPGQDPQVDENLIANCTSMTKEFGDWYLGVVADGEEFLKWVF